MTISEERTTYLVERLREAFKERRYGAGGEYHPDFDLFEAAADEIEKLRRALHASEQKPLDPRAIPIVPPVAS